MSDMTRAEAIDKLKNDGCGCCSWMSINPLECENTACEMKEAYKIAINSLQIDEQYDLMYEQAEPKTGHWIEKDGYDGDVYYDCSECGESWTTIEGTPWNNGMKYCPNCGADMRGTENDD